MSLSEIYLLEFNLMFPSQESFLRVKEVLAICLASLKPLTVNQIYEYTNSIKEAYPNNDNLRSSNANNSNGKSSDNTTVTWQEFSTHFEMLSFWLLPERADKTVMFFHSTVRDW